MTINLNFIGLVVADLASSLRFYRLLGIEIPEESDAAAHVEAVLPSGVRIGWDTIDTIRSFDPGWTAPTGSSRMALAFECGSPAEVDSTFDALTDAGYQGHVSPWDAIWGQRYATVHDPDGNSIDLYAALPE